MGVALLRHLCLRDGTLGIGASQSLYDLLGGDAPTNDGAKESWKVSPQPAVLLSRSFKVTSKSADGSKLSIGELSLKLEDASTPAKPAGK